MTCGSAACALTAQMVSRCPDNTCTHAYTARTRQLRAAPPRHAYLGANVPHAGRGVARTSDQHVQRRMQRTTPSPHVNLVARPRHSTHHEYTPDKWPWYCRTTLFASRSQHLTVLSSPAEKRNGERVDTASPRMALMWPVSDNFNCNTHTNTVENVNVSTLYQLLTRPVAISQILIVLSAEPVTNHCIKKIEKSNYFFIF